MNTTRTSLRRCSCFLLCILLLMTLLPVPAHAAGSDQTLVRAAWYEDSYNITGKNGERSGYGYEYEQAIAAYTGWSYEYVENGWADLLEMIKNGEIDIMGGISYTEERAQSMLFSDLPMGHEKYYLYADLAHTDISSSDLTTLNGKRVALMPTSVQATQFYEWEEAHDLHLEYVPVNSFEEGKRMAENREIDCVISTETPAWVEFGMSAIAVTGGSDIYFAISKSRPDLKNQLDTAMRQMENDKPFYADELYQRYLSAVATPTLSTEEQDWLAQHGNIRVGFLMDDPGISTYREEDGLLYGVMLDYLQSASDCLNNQHLEFDLQGYNTIEEEIQALTNGEIDMIFHFNQNPYIAEKYGLSLSNTVLSFNVAAVTTLNLFNENDANRVAVVKDNLLYQWYLSYNYPDWEILTYNTEKQAENAVLNGEADCLIATSGELSRHDTNGRLHSVFLTRPGNTSFALKLGDATLMSILNKTLHTIPSSMLAGAMSMYQTSMQKVTLADFIKDNLLVVSTGLILFFTLILLLVLSFLRKSRAAEAKAKQEAGRSQELNRKLQESQTELQAALLRAESANSAKTTFLNNVSHDIRTPMNAIVGLTSLMENEPNLSQKMIGYLGKLKASSNHLLNLINEILDMNKIESGKATLNVEPFNIAEQVAQIDSVIRPQAKARSQKFTIQTHNIRHENLEGDATRLQQILLNILSNAVKYTDRGGHIEFDLEELPRDGHYARYKFTVTDNGIGMSEEFQKHIYESFTRAEKSVTNKVQGTGLGMAITKSIVDMMGGGISLESKLGKGTRFEVMLEFKIDQKADDAVKQMSLLLLRCSDDSFARIQAAAANHPVSVYRTTSPKETEQLLRTNHYDVVLMPYQIYGDDLNTAVQRVRALAGDETILLGTATVQRDEAMDALSESGLDGFVPMPFFLSNLEAEVARARERRTSANRQEERAILNGMNFLCAEDNPLNAEILQAMLEMQGASCTICTNGAEIVEKFRSVQPGEYDAILMDVQMPKMNGYDATRAIRSGENPLGKTIPIIAMTANAFAEDIQKSYDAGMDSHLSKPVNLKLLEQTLRKFRRTPPRNKV